MKEEKFAISGMHCGHCTKMVKNSIELVPGVTEAEVTLGSAKVLFDENAASKEDLEKAITRFGYKVRD